MCECPLETSHLLLTHPPSALKPLLSEETLEKNINLLECHRGARSPTEVTSPQAVTEPGREELLLGE